MLKITDSTKSQGAIGLNQTLNKQAESTSINNIAITSPSNNISQLKSTDVNNTNSEVGIKTLDNELPFQLKSGIEQLSGISMGDVKVHHNSDKLAQLQAHAYAQGTDIHLAKGQEKHLPHEAWHVVQQKQGRVKPTTQFKIGVPINDDLGLEKEADVMGAKALKMTPFSLSDYKTEKSVQKKEIIQREPDFAYPEKEKPEKTVGELISSYPGKAPESTENVVPQNSIVKDTENSMITESPEEISQNQRLLAVNSLIIVLTTYIKKYKEKKAKEEAEEKEKKDKEARITEAEVELERAKKAEADALETAKKAKAAKKEATAIARKEEKIEKAKKDKEEGLKKQAELRAALLVDIENAEEESEKANMKIHENINEDSNFGKFLKITAIPANSIDTVAEFMEESLIKTKLEDLAPFGAILGNISDTCDSIESVGKALQSGKTADWSIVGLNVNKFVIGVLNTIETANKNSILNEALKKSVSGLLPGIGGGLSAFKNLVEHSQVVSKRIAIKELQEHSGKLSDDEKLILNQYKESITYKLREIKLDFLLNTAQLVTMMSPGGQLIVAGIQTAVNVFKIGRDAYINFQANKEINRLQRIKDVNIEDLKDNKILEKSKKNPNVFIQALKLKSEKEHLITQTPQDDKLIKANQDELDKQLGFLNFGQFGKDITDEGNLKLWLKYEQDTINSIAEEVRVNEQNLRWYSEFFEDKKDKIIPLMRQEGILVNDEIKLEDIRNLKPDQETYFFDKTQISIKANLKREYIPVAERLDRMEKMFLTKFDDDIIKNHFIEKYKDEGVYNTTTDNEYKRFVLSVKKFMKEVKI